MTERISTTFPIYGIFFKIWANDKLSQDVFAKAVQKYQELNPNLQFLKGQTFEFDIEDVFPPEA